MKEDDSLFGIKNRKLGNEYPRNIIETVDSWMAEKKNETCTNEEWHQLFENEKKVIVPKGQLFFRSKLYSEDGIYYLYPSDVDVSVLDKKDKSLGLGVYYETNKYKLWKDYLSWNLTRWDKNGSHENALKNALQRRDEIKEDINAMLKGHKYDDWKLLSKKITIITGRVRRAKDTLEKSELELSRLSFDPTRN